MLSKQFPCLSVPASPDTSRAVNKSPISLKRCSTCQKTKSTTEFWKNSRASDGLQGQCKDCKRASRLRTIDWAKRKFFSRRYYENNSQHVKGRMRDYRMENRAILMAHATVARAIKDGELGPRPCEVCGKVRADAHHDDYSKPLSVRWLCRRHHREYHAALAEDVVSGKRGK